MSEGPGFRALTSGRRSAGGMGSLPRDIIDSTHPREITACALSSSSEEVELISLEMTLTR